MRHIGHQIRDMLVRHLMSLTMRAEPSFRRSLKTSNCLLLLVIVLRNETATSEPLSTTIAVKTDAITKGVPGCGQPVLLTSSVTPALNTINCATHTHTHMYTGANTHRHTRIHTYTHTHTQMVVQNQYTRKMKLLSLALAFHGPPRRMCVV